MSIFVFSMRSTVSRHASGVASRSGGAASGHFSLYFVRARGVARLERPGPTIPHADVSYCSLIVIHALTAA